jgi:hypothetical protein
MRARRSDGIAGFLVMPFDAIKNVLMQHQK